jgi:glycosyltransferase involved in cell wall biosynthesis/O-antigen/teichoic acid export membrane protein
VTAGTLAFNVVLARGGQPGGYGAVSVLLSAGTLGVLVGAGAQNAVARRVRVSGGAGRDLVATVFGATGVWLVGALVLAALSPLMAGFLHLASPLWFTGAAGIFALTVLASGFMGVLLGAGLPIALVAVQLLAALVRIAIAAVLVLSGDAVMAGIIATLASTALAAVLAFRWSTIVGRRVRIRPVEARASTIAVSREALVSSVFIGALWTAWSIPLAVSRHSLPATSADQFAVMQLLVSGVVLLAAPIASAFHPVIAREPELRTIAIGGLATVGLAVGGLVALPLLGPALIPGLFGGRFTSHAALTVTLCASGLAVAGANYAIWVVRALQRAEAMMLMGAAVALGLSVLFSELWQNSSTLLGAVAGVSICVAAGAAIVGVAVTARRSTRPPIGADGAQRILVLNWKDAAAPDAGGAEVYVQRLAESWHRKRYDVTLLTSVLPGHPSVETVDGIHRIRLGTRHTVFSHARRYVRQHGAMYDAIVESVSQRPFAVHGLTTTPVTVLYYHVASEQWTHELGLPLGWLGRRVIEPWWLRQIGSSRVIALSPSTASDLRARGLAVHGVMHPGADPVAAFTPRRGPSPAPRLLFVGRLTRAKLPLDAVIAFELVRRVFPSATLDVVGDGYLLPRLVDRAAEGVTVHGYLSEARKRDLMRDADLVLLPATREGWGLVVTEAASLGVPVVAYDVPGVRDAVADGRTGLLTAPAPQALATAATRILSDADLWRSMSREATRQAAARTWTDVADEFLAVMFVGEAATSGLANARVNGEAAELALAIR